ncbi:MAG TPA: alpha/beta fold hydrolase, partial [Polyangia bacterium]
AVACVAEDDPSGQKRLVAYVVPEDDAFRGATALRRALGACLPVYMVPSQIVPCRSLPLTSNGKIDRRPTALREHAARMGVGLALDAPEGDGDLVGAATRPRRDPKDEPRGPHERVLEEIWRELLGVPAVGRHDNFYDLGGHSLLAVKMVMGLRERLRVEVPVSALVAYPTIAKLASFVATCVRDSESDDGSLLSVEASEEEDTIIEPGPDVTAMSGPEPEEVPVRRGTPHLFALNASGTKPPLVLVAGLGGHAFTFGIFPRLLGDDQPIYAFHAVGTDPSQAPRRRTIEEIAEIYEAELDRVLPRGPVVLGGFSFGALPAFELARRLVRRGQEVPLFVSLDGFAPAYPRRLPLPARLWAHGRELLTGGPNGRLAYLAKTRRNLRTRLLRASGRQLELVPDLHEDDALNVRAKQHWLENKRAMRLYRPGTGIPSALLLIRQEQPERWLATKMDDPLYGWGDHVGGPATLATLPGSHLALMRSPANQKAAADVIAKHIHALGASRVTASASR